MSQFTKFPGAFHKAAAFDFPKAAHPPTPPETDVDSFSTIHPPFFTPSGLKADPNDSFMTSGPTDTPSARPMSRKSSNLSYISSGITRVDQRFGSPRPPATRWLVVVSPPPAMALENGSTMFLNPSRQESQSVLLPLFPSLSRQLSAVAREFSFPSTSGICMFLRLPEHGIPYSSRLSEESWSILWAHVLYDERPVPGSSTGGLPIAGRLEFDIDLRKARWYDAWVTAMRREYESTPVSTTPSLVNHAREDSRATQHTDTAHDESEDLTIAGPKRHSRHIPRKLSLIEKLDSNSSVRSLSRPVSRQGHSPPHNESFALHALSPIPQLDEPKSAIKVLESKVENWRASAVFSKSPLTHTEPTLLPATIPSSEQAEDEDDEGQELNLDDFAWSISSAGPPSDVPWSALSLSSFEVPSIHIANRAEGSVCLTPSTCTSWGPEEYALNSPVSSISRLPSPDLAFRGYDYVPLTPSTATSWGPPVDWEDFPLTAASRVPSIDLAGRAMSSRPCTPSTATSWGPPLEWPETPATPYRVGTPDVGQRSFDDDNRAAAPWEHVWPYTERKPAASSAPWRHVWPYSGTHSRTSSSESSTWKLVWPYRHGVLDSEGEGTVSEQVHSGYPYFNLYPAVYPHFDLYPALPEIGGSAFDGSLELPATYPRLNIYPAVYPYFEIYPGDVVAPQEIDGPLSVKLEKVYPALDIYPVVYPVFEIYPGNVVDLVEMEVMTPLPVKLQAHYPALDIYAAVYPNIIIYPPVNTVEDSLIKSPLDSVASRPIVVELKRDYPNIDIYPAVYPHNLDSIYPTHLVEEDEEVSGPIFCTLSSVYPSFDIYPSVYPNLNIYPDVVVCAPEEFVQGSSDLKGISVRLEAAYPNVEPYSPEYPYIRIYPEVHDSNDNDDGEVVHVQYPNFDIYPAVYPYFDIYKSGFASTPEVLKVGDIALPATYPRFNIYPAEYPYFDIYSTGHPTLAETEELEIESVSLSSTYPRLNIYPAVYPYFDIYATGHPTLAEVEPGVGSITLSPSYPRFDIYSAVYPYFDIYSTGFPTLAENEREVEVGTIALAASYPNFNIYPAVYPFFDIFSSGCPTTAENEQKAEVGPIVLGSSYPRINIYPPVYPHFDIYNEAGCLESDSSGRRLAGGRVRKTHQELHDAVMARLDSVSSPSLSQRMGRVRKTHDELYNEVIKSSPDALRIDTTSVGPTRSDRSPPESHVAGLPVKPSDIRRAASLNRGSTPPASQPLRRFASTSDRTTSNHSRHNSITRSPLGTIEPVSGSPISEESSPVRRKPSRRDSIVLEKARHWGAPATQAIASSSPFNQITVEDLSAFPMPPMPPLPVKSNTDLNRPIAKLDRSKLPFH